MRSLQDRFGGVIENGDPIVVAVLAGTALVEVLVSGGSMLDAVVGAAIALPLLARRRAPLLVLALVIALGYAGYARGASAGARCRRGSCSTSRSTASRRTASAGALARAP